MSIKCSVYIAASIDGFIAKPGGDIEWLNRPEYAASKLKGLSYDDFIATIDVLIMGRHSFEKVLSFDHWPYENILVVVLTSRELEIPEHLQGKVKIESGQPDAILSRLSSQNFSHFYIDGGITIQRFLTAKRINEITITWIPILLGGGIPLFGILDAEQPLQLIEAIPSENGFVQLRYSVQ